MNTLQYYLTKLAEEASEVAQIALKTQQFGPYEKHPGLSFNNYERCHQELNDMLAVVAVLNRDFGFGFVPDNEAHFFKQEKMLRYKRYSIELGLVDNDAT